MIVLLREFLSGFAEHGAARTAFGIEASRRVGVLGQFACDAGPAFFALQFILRLAARRRLLPARRRQRGLPGVFGGPPSLASSSAMRLFCAFTCASNRRCAHLWRRPVPRVDRYAPAATPPDRRPSLLGESFFSLRHGERESARRTRPQHLRPESQRRREVSNYAFFVFSGLAPGIATKFGVGAVTMILPMQLMAGMGRAVSPVSGSSLRSAKPGNARHSKSSDGPSSGNRRDDHDDTDELSLERVIGELACDVARADG